MAPVFNNAGQHWNHILFWQNMSPAGGKIPGAPPDWPPASNLTPGEGSVLPRYAEADAFIAMMRTGKRPDGSAVSKVMPFQSLANFNDTDLKAIHAFLKTLPPRKAGER